ncbi:universal stress protein [Pontivivens ytuae]|uniref:Universal stress protein n=1 Tax=Pontivivens ytuae TaxID=2789856 RepID=A0A7S9LVT9_9RHOB|nr:universal stress protein [Pontivivens ytuae]QPH56044.1 universal stress protein [Pontivivens ytuae]
MADKLLIPIDLSHKSSWLKALPQAFALAEATGAEVTIMTVVPEVVGGLDWRYSIRGETGGSEELKVDDLLQDARKRLEQIGNEHAADGTGFDVIARYGTVYEEILNVADELPAAQIVMAAHRPSLADYLIGPNTARVVRHAKCSVQVVRD